MTLQLKVGGTYRARNGDIDKIVHEFPGKDRWPFLGSYGLTYGRNGAYGGANLNEQDLIEEISPPSPASELDEAIAKFERVWSDAKQAMDKAQLAADDVEQAINAAKESANEPR